MKRLFNFLRGMATVVVSGPFPERFLNLCAQERIDFWAVAWLDGHTLRLTLRAQTLTRAEELARRAGCAFRVEGRQGLAVQLSRFRRRYGFLAGLSLSLCAVAVLSQFVLTIQVTGNERVSTAVIRNQLRQLGVRPGVYGPGLDRKQLAQQALLGLEDLAWMGLNLHGTRLEVIVRETIEPPEGIDETGYFDVVAEADGVVTGAGGCRRPGGGHGGGGRRADLRPSDHGPAAVQRRAHPLLRDPRPGADLGQDLAHPGERHPPDGPGKGLCRGGEDDVVSGAFGAALQNFWKE